MALKIGEAFVRLFVNRSELKDGLDKGKKDVETFAKSAKEFIHDLVDEVERIIIPVGLAASIIEIGRAAFESAAEVKELSQETGLSVEQISRLQYAAGRSFGDFSTAIRTLNQRVTEAIQHGGQAAADFESVGISVDFLKKNANNLEPILLKIADRFHESADGAGKVTVASSLFGARIGIQMIPVLNKGSDAIKRLGEEADRTGATLSGKAAEDAEQYEKSFARLKQTIESEVAPGVIAALKLISIAGVGAANAISQGINNAIVTVKVAADLESFSFRKLGKDVNDWNDTRKELDEQVKNTIDLIEGTDKKLDEMGSDGGAGHKPLSPIIDAIVQANAALAASNVQIRAQISLAQHAAPVAERLTREYERQADVLMIHQMLDPVLVREKTHLEDILRVTQAINAAEEQGRKLRQQYQSDEVSTRSQILAILLKGEQAERQAVIDNGLIKKNQLFEALRQQTQQAHDTIKNEEDLQIRLTEIRNNYDNLEIENEALVRAKLLEIDRKYGANVAAIADQLLQKQRTLGQSVIESIDQIQSAMESNLGDAFFAAITGHIRDLQSAFRSLVDSILHEITNLMARAVVRQFFSFFASKFALTVPSGDVSVSASGFANGGIAAGGFRAFDSGGIVSQPTLGLVGEGSYNEAVVPLPDGSRIPVQLMSANRGTDDHIAVHVSWEPGLIASVVGAGAEAGYSRFAQDVRDGGPLTRQLIYLAKRA